jgi:phosphatidylglycerol---prolipoprotein diacylglyceryl transferase
MSDGIVWDVRYEVIPGLALPRWYSLLFAAGIVLGYLMVRDMFRKEGKPVELVESLLMHVVLGMMIGMRLGHCLFYQPEYYLSHPLEMLMIWKGGYASHGGFLGVLIALGLFVRRYRDIGFLWLSDRVAVASMMGAGFIRVGNFFNSEMIGHPTDVPWAVTFARVDMIPRHPGQLYEAIGYFVISAIAYAMYREGRVLKVPGRLLGIVLALGFAWRFFCEFFKEDQVAFEQGMTLNMGQWLSVPFMVLGVALVLGLFKPRRPSL